MTRARLSAYTAAPDAVVTALDALRARSGIPQAFPDEALAQAARAAQRWAEDGPARLLAEGARDARDLPLVTIDPPGSMDLDQAVLLERLDHAPATEQHPAPGRATAYRVHYAIASLATFVPPDGALDAELRRRGETVYAPDTATPLHPEVLSHGAASLLEDQDRPACLWTIDLDRDGEVVQARVERALVRSRARLTYAQVQENLDDPGAHPLPDAVPAGLAGLLERIGRLRQEREADRGGVSLATPEQEIEAIGRDGGGGAQDTDQPDHQPGQQPGQQPDQRSRAGAGGHDDRGPGDQGAPGGYRLVYRSALPVEGYNAQISLLTGICAAQMMMRAGVGVLRTMPPASPEDYQRLRRVARALRIDWPQDLSYPDLVRSLDHAVPAHAAFLDQALSLFRGAGYLALPEAPPEAPPEDRPDRTEPAEAAEAAEQPEQEGGRQQERSGHPERPESADPAERADRTVHAAIAAPYAHVTAPLRRLVDRYGLEVCLALSAGRPVPDWVLRALPALPGVMAETGRRAKAVGRGAVAAMEALVLSGHEGEVFEGVITSVRQGVGELMLADPAVVSQVRADNDEAGPSGRHRLPLGQRVRARLVLADPLSGRTEFVLL